MILLKVALFNIKLNLYKKHFLKNSIKLVYVANIVSHYFLLDFIFDMNYFKSFIAQHFLLSIFPKDRYAIELYVSFLKNYVQSNMTKHEKIHYTYFEGNLKKS